VLGLLATPACPVHHLALAPPALLKALAHIKRHMQDADGPVRDAAVEALLSFARAASDAAGAPLPGAAAANPYLRIAFECLAEQRKESQWAAGAALLQLAPLLQPLERDLVKAVLRSLRSPAFQGGAALLSALGNTGGGGPQRAEGLLRVRAAGPAACDCPHAVMPGTGAPQALPARHCMEPMA
jgi:hypothetical protein